MHSWLENRYSGSVHFRPPVSFGLSIGQPPILGPRPYDAPWAHFGCRSGAFPAPSAHIVLNGDYSCTTLSAVHEWVIGRLAVGAWPTAADEWASMGRGRTEARVSDSARVSAAERDAYFASLSAPNYPRPGHLLSPRGILAAALWSGLSCFVHRKHFLRSTHAMRKLTVAQ